MDDRVHEAIDKLVDEVQLTAKELHPISIGPAEMGEEPLAMTLATYVLARLAIRLTQSKQDLDTFATVVETSAVALKVERVRQMAKQTQ